MTIRKVGVVGCGLMGGGIAQTCAQSGYEAEAIYEEYKDPLYAPPPLLRRMVQSGKKSGRGFYDYQ